MSSDNPFKQTVEHQIAALREQSNLGGWGIADEVLVRLAETAPAWPEGRDAHRSFRIRFGEGRDGVVQTFDAHIEAIGRVLKFWLSPPVFSGIRSYQGENVERLRLLNGNESHHAVVEWIIISDLSAHRKRESVTAVRDSKSLADEGLVLVWLNPKRAEAVNHEWWHAWFCAGYELNVSGYGPYHCVRGKEVWRSVVCVSRDLRSDGTMYLYANWYGVANSCFSVPFAA